MTLAVAQKFHYTNPKIHKHAEGQVCQCCGADDGTIVAAHCNQQEHGRGAFLQAHDLFLAYLCSKCHYWLDYGKGTSPCGLYQDTRQDKKEMFAQAMCKTLLILVRDGVLR